MAARLSAEFFGPNAASECFAWAAYGAVTGALVGAGISCGTAVAAYFDGSDNLVAKCFIWGAGAVVGAQTADELKLIEQTVSNCLAAAISTVGG